MSEASIIARLGAVLGRRQPPPGGIGDDGALLRADDGRVIVVDTVCEGTHFRLDWSLVADVAYKAIAVNVSDIWAMGAEPTVWLLSLGLPEQLATDEVMDELIAGFSEARDLLAPSLELVGGDTLRAPVLTMTVTMVGHCQTPFERGGARPGQTLWVNGPLGLSRAGLELLRGGHLASGPFVDIHRRPRPRVFDPADARRAGASAVMDVSDGIAADLRRLCSASNCGAEVRLPLPGFEELRAALSVSEEEIHRTQLLGGEDFVHLVSSESRPGPDFRPVGRIVEADLGLTVIGPDGSRRALPEAGFEHFDG